MAIADQPETNSSDKEPYNLTTVQATFEACAQDLLREEERMRSIDAKLTQLAAFSGISISITGGLGGSMLASGGLPLGFAIAVGALISAAALLLLAGVVQVFWMLSPKKYLGVDEGAVAQRTIPSNLRREPEVAIAEFAASRREALKTARGINDKKAEAAIQTFICVGIGFTLLVLGLIVAAVGSVV